MKVRVKCVRCDCFLREKTRAGNDFSNRMLCHSCYKDTGYGYYMLKQMYPEKVAKFFEEKEKKEEITLDDDFDLDFGKYQGIKRSEVFKKDRGYCKWCYENLTKNPRFSNKRFIKYLILYYSNNGN